jgi:alpha-beta hydrolase superfamily lysophospholipase
MSQRYEGFIEGYQGLEIFYQGWRLEKQRGTVLITHGLGEHSDIYDPLARALNLTGWAVVAYDLRGHGRSEGQRGYVADFKNLERDLSIMIDFVATNVHVAGGPLVLFGHSLGGLITLKTVLTYSFSNLAALCLSSPALGVALEVPAWKHRLAQAAASYLPRLTMFNELYSRQLISDPNVQADYDRDPLRHDKISPGLYLGILAAMTDVEKHSTRFELPVLLQIPRRDSVVDSEASIRFFDHLTVKRKVLKIYENSLHEVFNDIERDHALRDLGNFLDAIS